MLGRLKQISPSQLELAKNEPGMVKNLLFPEQEDRPNPHLDIDKTWDMIHFILTENIAPNGTPEGDAILGGTPIGEDMSYGPAVYLEPERVTEVSNALQAISTDEFWRRYDPEKMEKLRLYPGFRHEITTEGRDYISKIFRSIKDYYKDASEKGNAMLFCIY